MSSGPFGWIPQSAPPPLRPLACPHGTESLRPSGFPGRETRTPGRKGRIAEGLLAWLGYTGRSSYAPPSANRKYAGEKLDPQGAGQEQGVDAVLNSRIQREADRVRLTVHLIRVRDGEQLWAESRDKEITNIFALEDALSERVAQSIRLKLTGEETRRLTKCATEKPDTYEA
jgi:hypothetical protein